MLIEILLCRLGKRELASLSKPSGLLSGLLTNERVDAISEQLTRSQGAITSLLQAELRCRAQPHPALATAQLVSENPALGTSVSNLQQEPLDQSAAIASRLLGALDLLGCQHGHPRPYPRPGRRTPTNHNPTKPNR